MKDHPPSPEQEIEEIKEKHIYTFINNNNNIQLPHDHVRHSCILIVTAPHSRVKWSSVTNIAQNITFK